MTRNLNGHLKRVLVVENPSTVLDQKLHSAGVEVRRLDYTPTEEQLIQELNDFGAHALFKRSRVEVSRRVIESCPDLFVIQLCCIGDDSIDKQACADHGVMIFNDPVSNGRSVIELVIGNLITLSRRLYETTVECRDGIWNKNNLDRYEVRNKVLGVLGLGNIGRGVARAAEALGMKICFFDTRQVSVELGTEMGWKHIDSLEEMFRSVDCMSVHLSAKDIHGSSNANLLSDDLFRQFGLDRPPGPRVFINFSRGFLHNPSSLIKAVDSGIIRKAAVDVYPKEPRKGESWENPYKKHSQIAVFPHIGASTKEAQPRIARRVADTFFAFSNSGAVRDTPFRTRMVLGLTEGAKTGEVLLAICHSTTRGTKKAIDELIYEAGASNLASIHKDFKDLGFAYELAKIDKELTADQLSALVENANLLTNEDNAIRSIRQIVMR